MIWFFERGSDSLQIETRYNHQASAFEIVWHHSDGSETLESFADEGQFRKRSEEVEARLLEDDWHPAGSPQLLRHGWKLG